MSKKRTPLSKFNVLPQLVDGRCVILNPNNKTYDYIAFGQYCQRQEPFKVEDYTVLETDKYRCLVNSTHAERLEVIVNKSIKQRFLTQDWYTRNACLSL